jgi:hypothetical protein
MTLTTIRHFPRDHYQRPGIYRRCLVVTSGPDWARAELEDDPHRYGVTIRHDGERITEAQGRALRTPWSACGEAVSLLERLHGMPLSPDPQQVYRHTNGREQCTHLLDLAGLAQAHAARDTVPSTRRYDAEVPCHDPAAPRDAVLHLDGQEILRWALERNTIAAPPPFAGHDVPTLMPWAKARFVDRDQLQAIWILRRAIFVAGNRFFDLDRLTRASDTGHVLGACHVYSEGVVERATRVHGATRDFSEGGAGMVGELVEE